MRVASSWAAIASRWVFAASSSACAAATSAVSVRFSASAASNCMVARPVCASAPSSWARTSASSFSIAARACAWRPRCLLSLEAGGIDGRVRFDGGVEIAVGGVGALGLAGDVAAQRFDAGLGFRQVGAQHVGLGLGLGERVGELVVLFAAGVNRAPGGIERGARLLVRLGRLALRRRQRRVRVGKLGANGVDLG